MKLYNLRTIIARKVLLVANIVIITRTIQQNKNCVNSYSGYLDIEDQSLVLSIPPKIPLDENIGINVSHLHHEERHQQIQRYTQRDVWSSRNVKNNDWKTSLGYVRSEMRIANISAI